METELLVVATTISLIIGLSLLSRLGIIIALDLIKAAGCLLLVIFVAAIILVSMLIELVRGLLFSVASIPVLAWLVILLLIGAAVLAGRLHSAGDS